MPMSPRDAVGTSAAPINCELCEAARMTRWYYEDDACWVAECEFCSVPMVVWKVHAPAPSQATKDRLHARLHDVMSEHFTFAYFIDDKMRNIPDHYHAHARRRLGTRAVMPSSRV